jgi:polysaccharide pyruvyl transferase CsaB
MSRLSIKRGGIPLGKILISGYYGFSNAGDEAMLTAIVTSLKEQDPQVELTVLSGHPEVTARLHPVKAIHRFDLWGICRAMAGTDLLLSGGGSLLQNVTSRLSLYYYLSIIALGTLLGKKVMLFAQGIGPIRGSFSRWLTRLVCQKVDLITVRDDGSLDDLKAMGFSPEKIRVTSDAVFSLPEGRKEEGTLLLDQLGVDRSRPLVGFALRHWKGEERFIQEFAKAADALKYQYQAQILFLPLQFPADAQLSAQVEAAMEDSRDVFILDQKCSTQGYQDLICNLHLLIGMRLHALVFAAINDVPFMAISYDPKVDRFVDGMKGNVVDTIGRITSEELVSMAGRLWHADGRQGRERICALREEARANIGRALELIHR